MSGADAEEKIQRRGLAGADLHRLHLPRARARRASVSRPSARRCAAGPRASGAPRAPRGLMRCFIAAWPDRRDPPALRAADRRAEPRVPHARAMQARNLHLTLAFIGELDAAAATRAGATMATSCCRTTRLDDRLPGLVSTRARRLGRRHRTELDAAASARATRAARQLRCSATTARRLSPMSRCFGTCAASTAAARWREPLSWRTEHVALYAAARDETWSRLPSGAARRTAARPWIRRSRRSRYMSRKVRPLGAGKSRVPVQPAAERQLANAPVSLRPSS